MISNRMLAVAVVLVLAVPAIGAAAPIVQPLQPEQLVEGHTVFTVIDQVRIQNNTRVTFAAAVAVLVREYVADNAAVRFPGVLWFNDQYLVNPYDASRDAAAYRYPCGGAVMAVNSGDPDPRMTLVSNYPNQNNSLQNPATGGSIEYLNGTDYSQNNLGVLNVDPANPTLLYTDAVQPDTGTSATAPGYVESYLVTDPNDHVWIIDKYRQLVRTTLGGATVSYTSTLWVVNMHGGPVFRPDDQIKTCAPYEDFYEDLNARTGGALPAWPGGCADLRPLNQLTTQQDDPCAGYNEPSDNAYCYNGNPAPCATTAPTRPIRLYNAVLYFELDDLLVAGADKNHAVGNTDTNGCQAGTEWDCPGGSDDNEGNSHPFHPTPTGRVPPNPAHTDVGSPCPSGSPYNFNHGGSGNFVSTGGVRGRTFYADGDGCNLEHGTRNIDLYFSGDARPLTPLVRSFTVQDTQGSDAPFFAGSH